MQHGAVLHGAVPGAEPLFWITPRGGSVAPLAPDKGLGGGSSPGKLATFWQLISSIASASLGSLSHRGCQGECTNIRHNEVEESFASVFWSHCHNKSGYTTPNNCAFWNGPNVCRNLTNTWKISPGIVWKLHILVSYNSTENMRLKWPRISRSRILAMVDGWFDLRWVLKILLLLFGYRIFRNAIPISYTTPINSKSRIGASWHYTCIVWSIDNKNVGQSLTQ